MYICLCRGITESKARQLWQEGHTSAEALIEVLGLDDADACGFCERHIDEFVAVAEGQAEAALGRNARKQDGGQSRGG